MLNIISASQTQSELPSTESEEFTNFKNIYPFTLYSDLSWRYLVMLSQLNSTQCKATFKHGYLTLSLFIYVHEILKQLLQRKYLNTNIYSHKFNHIISSTLKMLMFVQMKVIQNQAAIC